MGDGREKNHRGLRKSSKRVKFMKIPDEMYLLCILNNVGAINPERALEINEVARWASMEPLKAEESLNKLVKDGYVEAKVISGVKKYFATVNGIRRVLSIYS